MRGGWVLGLVLVGCSGDDSVNDTDAADTDVADTDDTNEPACVAVADGTYVATGSCFAMTMTVDLAFDAGACAFSLDNWSMNHGDAPDGGSLDGDAVTLTGTGFDGCAGTWAADAMTGTCDDGCVWELALD